MAKVLLALSGGLDSATLLAYLRRDNNVEALHFQYGSKHNTYELYAAIDVANHYNVPIKVINLSAPFASLGIKSNLLIGDNMGEIPEGHYNEDSMKQTIVPGRNLIIASFLASYAESHDFDEIALGVHQGDHHIYPDCRPSFINHLRQTILASTNNMVKVTAPFLYMNKQDIVKKALSFSVPLHLTRTCYKQQQVSCGKCGSCRERLEAFELNNASDTLTYTQA